MVRTYSVIAIVLSSCAAGFPPEETSVAIESSAPSPSEQTLGDLADAIFDEDSDAARDPAQLWVAGDQALRAGRLEEAVACFEKGARRLPRREAWKLQRAEADALVALRRFEEAERMYRGLLKGGEHPKDSTLLGNLAVACFRQGKLEEARAASLSALELNSVDVEAAKTLGLVELRSGARAQGVARLEQALARKPRIPEAQVALAELDALEGRPREAALRYRQLAAWLPEALSRDYHRRWADLFFPCPRTTAQELEWRISRLEESSKGSSENPEKEKQ